MATNILADYATDQPALLADLLLDADEKQFAVLYPKLQVPGDRGLTLLLGEVDKPETYGLPAGWSGFVGGMMTLVRVLPPEQYEKIMDLKARQQREKREAE